MSELSDRNGQDKSRRILHELHFTSDGLGSLLEQVAVLAAETLEVDASAGITVIRDADPGTVASSDERALRLDEIQYGNGDGPCLHAARTGQVITVSDAATEPRWPDAMAAARAQGLRSSLSLPLSLQEPVVGALNVYAFERHDFTDDHNVGVLVDFCKDASHAISLSLRHDVLTTERDHLHAAMGTRRIIDQALGIVMAQNRCSSEDAFAILRKASQNRNVKLRDLAAEIIHQVTGNAPSSDTNFRF